MTKYDAYKLLASNGDVIKTFSVRQQAIDYLKYLYTIKKDAMFVVDTKGNVLFD